MLDGRVRQFGGGRGLLVEAIHDFAISSLALKMIFGIKSSRRLGFRNIHLLSQTVVVSTAAAVAAAGCYSMVREIARS
jgi:hypothetical protein